MPTTPVIDQESSKPDQPRDGLQSRRPWPLLMICLITVAALTAYWQVKDHPFTAFDDNVYVSANYQVRNGLTPEGIRWAFGFQQADRTYWHPLTWLSHMLDVQLFGLDPGWHHLINLGCHIVNAILIYWALQMMTGCVWPSAIVALIFAVHPINVESVAWIAERKNVLSTIFWWLVILAYARYGKTLKMAFYGLTGVLLILGMLAKPMLVTLPCVLMLLDFWPLGRVRWPSHGAGAMPGHCAAAPVYPSVTLTRAVLEKLPLLFIGIGITLLATGSAQGHGTMIGYDMVPLDLRIKNALVSYGLYLKNAFWPARLGVFYPYPDQISWFPAMVAGVGIVSGIGLAVWAYGKRMPWLLIGGLWFLGTLVPVSGIVQTGLWPALADRWAYVPMTGIYIAVVWTLASGIRQSTWGRGQVVFNAMTVLIIGVLSLMTWRQVGYWKDDLTLFTHTLEVAPNNFVAHDHLGNAYAARGDVDQAIAHFTRALEIYPRDEVAYAGWGNLLLAQGKTDEAIRLFRSALKIVPQFKEVHVNLCAALMKTGKYDEAVFHCSESVRIDPGFKEGHYNLGIVLSKMGRIPEAIGHFSQAVRIDPLFKEAWYSLGIHLAHLGKLSDAKVCFAEALRIDPNFEKARQQLDRMENGTQ